MKQYILALDEGTTSARSILFDREGGVVSLSQHEIPQIYPQAGWVEQNPMDIYANQYSSLTECIAKSGVSPSEIAGVGITNQRETAIVWEKATGKPVYNAIVWQCRRTSALCEQLEREGWGDYIAQATGLRIDAYFSGTKIKWILDNVKGAGEKARARAFLRLRALEPAHGLDAYRGAVEPREERLVVLLREDGRRGEKGGLLAVHGGDESGAHGDLRLAVAGVAADEAIHRL